MGGYLRVRALLGMFGFRASQVPHPVWALVVCAAFTAVGVAVLDDYGVSWDEFLQREIGLDTISYVLGQDDELMGNHPRRDHLKFYGTAFELPLLIVERVLGLQDTRAILLSRHILTHLFFIASGFFCYLLTRRLFGSTAIALFAMLLFLLHPRLYAESFVNTKDLPLASMFMVALFLTHRAFSRDTVGAFLLCGLAVGILVNIRILGVVLFAAVPAVRALDLLFDAGRGRKHAFITGGVFALAAMFALYATLPYLWANPIERAVEMFVTLSHHPMAFPILFQGEMIMGNDLPPHYIPTWVAITTPPVALLLGVAGIIAPIRRGWASPRDILRHGNLKFGFLLIGCLTITLIAVVVVTPTIHSGWRLMYFLYAPFCVLAAFGLHCLASVSGRTVVRAAAYTLVGAGILVVVLQMVRIHPYQQAYFNFLVDRETPGLLGDQYPLEYWGTSYLDGLRWLTETYPDSHVHMSDSVSGHYPRNRAFLPESVRQKIVLKGEGETIGDFYMTNHFDNYASKSRVAVFAPIVHRREVYNNAVLSVAALDLSAADHTTAGAYRQIYRDAVTGSPVVSGSGFDVYHNEPEKTLTYVNESCGPKDVFNNFMLSLTPFDANNLPVYVKQRGENRRTLSFDFGEKGVKFDGKCLMVFQLPEYPIFHISIGHWLGGQYHSWGDLIELRAVERIIEDAGDPVIRGKFDVSLGEDFLLYSREPCAPADISDKFFLHLIPADRDDLPDNRQQYEFDNLDFNFAQAGAISEGKCIARALLPDYPITRIRTGQYIPESGQVVWEAETSVEE